MINSEKETQLFCKYLTGKNATPEVVIRYQHAIAELAISLTEREEKMITRLSHYHFLLPYIDGGMAISDPGGGIRKRLLALSALLETDKNFVDAYLTAKDLRVPVLRFLLIGVKAAITGGVGYLLVKLFQWK